MTVDKENFIACATVIRRTYRVSMTPEISVKQRETNLFNLSLRDSRYGAVIYY